MSENAELASIASLLKRLDAKDDTINRLTEQCDGLRDRLTRSGFEECDSIECNCGNWHHVRGLPERMSEIEDALAEAGFPLCNENGHRAIVALAGLREQRDALLAACEAVSDRFRVDAPHWDHEGDEESGVHDEDCRACLYECVAKMVRAAIAKAGGGNG